MLVLIVLHVDHFDLNTIMDFDEFFNQVEKHIGYIRYWDAENRLMKMSKMRFHLRINADISSLSNEQNVC